jgi:hypothetical protein
MPLRDPDKQDFRPVTGSAAIDNGVQCFVPWGLYRMVGEWNFYKNNTDPTVVQDEHFYAAPYYSQRGEYRNKPQFHLKGTGITAESYVKGPLEDWTEGALKLNGDGQYLSCSNDVLVQKNQYKVGRGNKVQTRTASGKDFYSPAVRDSNFLIELYVKIEPGQTKGVLMRKMSDAGFSLQLGNSGKLKMILKTGSPQSEAVSRTAVADGRWHHIIAECDRKAGKVNFYIDGKRDSTGEGFFEGQTLYSDSDLYAGGTPQGDCIKATFDFARICLGTLADAKTTIEELYAWQFNGPFLRDFCGNKPVGKRDAGAVELVE